MGRKSIETNTEDRKIIINLHNPCKTLSEISRIINRPRSTIQDTFNRYGLRKTMKNNLRNGNISPSTIRNVLRTQGCHARMKVNLISSAPMDVIPYGEEKMKLIMLKTCKQPTVKHSGGSICVWDCMSATRVEELHFIEGIIDSGLYINILKTNLHASVEKLGIKHNFVFMQDMTPMCTFRQ
ncbi:uncharacterized protein LOC143188855 [Calliopsis andreniformis]|uniref:uncharacterized protein LOC143188855 n=1 Tax=Calliopsis andreniformis TaxID=337506 RepID=UPI003FCCBCB5